MRKRQKYDPTRLQRLKADPLKYERHKANKRAWHHRNIEKRRAHKVVELALKAGTLKPRPCERCGFAFGIQAHHEDYSKPLDVVWLCTFCHGARHREIRADRKAA